MELLSLTVGAMQENCYFVIDEQKQTLIFDPGAEADEIKKLIDEEGLQPVAILLTHAHCDHIGAVDELREFFNIPVYIHKIEADFLGDPSLNLSLYTGQTIVVKPADNVYPDVLGDWSIFGFKMKLAHIPGHSPGSTIFIFSENGFVIGGDVLFQGSIGRTDFPGGSQTTLLTGIKEYLLPLKSETVIFPGHGNPTTIGEEILKNPYLKNL